MDPSSSAPDWGVIGCLAEPTRRRVYEAVRAAARPLTRDDVAQLVGIGRPLATFHLEALARTGLLDVTFARPAGRGGPGAGRPAKWYAVRNRDVIASLPPRRYELAAEILLRSVRAARATAELCAAAVEVGRRLGGTLTGRPLDEVLTRLGYQPIERDGGHAFANCPFHALVEADAETVCAMNQSLVTGLLEGLGIKELDAVVDPLPGGCCVRLRPRPPSG
ncbi:MAG: helix-turn-helix domain-containing protein [Acidothermus cellulolyticus]|nr:helix-turn-helix domain-containing protein [Acidothermus cellulolyticus]